MESFRSSNLTERKYIEQKSNVYLSLFVFCYGVVPMLLKEIHNFFSQILNYIASVKCLLHSDSDIRRIPGKFQVFKPHSMKIYGTQK